MSNHITLKSVDVDGAIRETAHDAGFGRMDLFRRGAIAGGGLLAGSALLGGLPALASAATKPSAKNDIAILNYALTLEYLEAAFYKAALAKARLRGSAASFARQIAPVEAAHVAALRKALGKHAVKSPKFNFGSAVTNQANFLNTAHTLENAGVQAYLGQAGNFKNPAYLGVAASILAVEARHAGAVGIILNKPISPEGSFEVGATMAQILKAVKGTGFITG
jgi:rubrerythrin